MKARVISSAAADHGSTGSPMSLKKSHLLHKKKTHWTTYILIILASLAVISLGYYFYLVKTEFSGFNYPLNLEQIEHLFGTVYGKRSGYYLTADEKNFIGDHGGECSYGEILYGTSENLLIDIFDLKEGDVLHDFGSGVGKFVIQARLTTNASKIVGTELSITRSVLAREARAKIEDLGVLKTNDSSLQLIEGSFLDLDISDVTHIYTCSTCFHDDLMNNIYNKILKEGKPGLQIVTLVMFTIPKKHKKLNRRLVLKTTHTLPMSWSSSSPGYHYVLEDRSAPDFQPTPEVEPDVE